MEHICALCMIPVKWFEVIFNHKVVLVTKSESVAKYKKLLWGSNTHIWAIFVLSPGNEGCFYVSS